MFPGGERPLYEQVRVHAARYGSLDPQGVRRALLHAETMAVDDVVALGVRSI